MAKTKKSKKNSQRQKQPAPKKNTIQVSSSEEDKISEESSVYEEEQLVEVDADEQAVVTSYNESFLNKNDYSNKQIIDYNSSLNHDDESVKQRINRLYRKKGKLNVVMIAEKPNIAELISQVLSKGKYSKDFWEGFKSYHFNNLIFKGVNANCTVLSVYGNVYEFDFDRDSDISKRDPFDILLNDPVYLYRTKIKNERMKGNKPRQRANLKLLEEYLAYYLGNADVWIFWMDWDKVGENIWIQVTEFIKNCISGFPLENIFRAEFFSLKHQQITKLINNYWSTFYQVSLNKKLFFAKQIDYWF